MTSAALPSDAWPLVPCAALLFGGWLIGRWSAWGERADYGRRFRTLAGLVVLVLGVAWIGGLPFALGVAALAIGCLAELGRLPGAGARAARVPLLFGATCVVVAFALMIVVRQTGGFGALVFLLAVVQLADVGAWLGGPRWGRRALAPALSPAKTREGFACGCAAAVLGALLFGRGLPDRSVPELVLAGLLLAVVALLGDLFASFLKRRHGVDDFGAALPGHGGLLDRFDSYLFTPPVLVWLLHDTSYGVGGGTSGAAFAWPLLLVTAVICAVSAVAVGAMERSIARRAPPSARGRHGSDDAG